MYLALAQGANAHPLTLARLHEDGDIDLHQLLHHLMIFLSRNPNAPESRGLAEAISATQAILVDEQVRARERLERQQPRDRLERQQQQREEVYYPFGLEPDDVDFPDADAVTDDPEEEEESEEESGSDDPEEAEESDHAYIKQ